MPFQDHERDRLVPGCEAGYRRRAEIYHLECDATEDHAFLAQLTTSHVKTVLEIPAGVGRNLPVWRQFPGCEVTVADVEPEMVARLLRQIVADPQLTHVRAIEADMTTLCLPGTFDRIIVPQESFQIVANTENAIRVLARLERHLSESGLLMIDLARLDAEARGPFPSYFDPQLADGTEVEEWSRPLEGHQTLSRTRTQFRCRDGMRFRFKYTLTGGPSWHSEMTLHNFQVDDFVQRAQAAGLDVLDIYSNYAMRPYYAHSARSIFLLKKFTPC